MVGFGRGASSETTVRQSWGQSWGMNMKGAHLATTAVLAAILSVAATQSGAHETGADAAEARQVSRGVVVDTITVTARKREENLQA